MKKFVKRILTVVLATTMLLMGTLSVNAAAYNEIMPRYSKYQTVSFDLSTSGTTSKSGSFVVTDAPGMLTYRNCSLGAALLTLTVAGESRNYVIPESNGTEVRIQLTCNNKGDTISYTVKPYTAGNYLKAVGSFNIYY